MTAFDCREQIAYLAYRFDDTTEPGERGRGDYLQLAEDVLTLVIAQPGNLPEVLRLLADHAADGDGAPGGEPGRPVRCLADPLGSSPA